MRHARGFSRLEKEGSEEGTSTRVNENDCIERRIMGGGRLS